MADRRRNDGSRLYAGQADCPGDAKATELDQDVSIAALPGRAMLRQTR